MRKRLVQVTFMRYFSERFRVVETGAKSDGEVVRKRKLDVFKKILKLALEDQSVKACEQAFKAYKAHKMELHKDTSMMMELNSKEEKEEHAMEVDGEKENESSGCCGEECGKTQHQAPQKTMRLKLRRELQRLSRDGVSALPQRRT